MTKMHTTVQNVTKITFLWLVTLWYPGGDIDKIYILSKSQGLVAAKPYPPPLLEKTPIFSLFIFFFFSFYCHHWASVVCRPSVRPLTFHILINSSEATGPIWTKLWWNGPWMAPFQNCVRWSRLPAKMAAKKKIEKRGWNFNCPLLL